MIELRKTLELVHRTLDEAKIAHALIGGLALGEHGVHRATSDIDLLIDGDQRTIVITILKNKGFNLRFESDEVLQFDGVGYLDILLANRPLSRQMLASARNSSNLNVTVVGAEDIIGLKIQAYKNDSTRELQDKADIQAIARNNPGLDFNRIKEFADLFDEWSAVEKLLKS